MYSCTCIVRVEADNMGEAEETVRKYLQDTEHLTYLAYVCEEKCEEQ